MRAELDTLVRGDHSDPHHILGGHPYKQGSDQGVIIRAYHPEAYRVTLLWDGQSVTMARIHPGGIFEADLKKAAWPFPYRFRFPFKDGNTWETEDPYRFPPTLGDMDLHLFNEGNHLRLYERLGAHLPTHGRGIGGFLCPLGPQCQTGQPPGGIQPLGRPPFSHAVHGQFRYLGTLSCPG